MKANTLARLGLREFLCRPAHISDLDAALQAAAKACLQSPGAQHAWASLRASEVRFPDRGSFVDELPYGLEVPVELAGRVCGTVGFAAAEPVNGASQAIAGLVSGVLSTWEARRRLAETSPSHTIVGCSAEIRSTEALAQRFATLDEPVLIMGETGVGKELVARTIHCLSPRQDEVLWAFNCAAVPEDLLVSELFGHRRGAFTGAIRDQRGRVEIANGAILFLDEVGDMGPKMQAALLRVIETGEIQQLGDEGKGQQVNVRIIAATNRDLETEVAEGRFRSDLYYRLSPLTIRVPALRERLADIGVLARHFLRLLERDWQRSLELGDNAIQQLVSYPFPGNARELRNLILRAAATCVDGRVENLELPGSSRPPASVALPWPRTGGAGRAISSGNHGAQADRMQPPPGRGHPNVGSKAARASSAKASFPRAEGRVSSTRRHSSGRHDGRSTDLSLSLEAVTADHLRKVLAMAEGNISEAARLLEIPRTTLQSKLERYGLL
jgi:transcriptional regulator with GAF, ATPase, and Fis domain